MYPVSEKFLKAIRKDNRSYYYSGTIVTKDGESYTFSNKDIVELLQITVGSGNVLLSTMVKKGLLIRVKRGWYSAKV